MAASSPTVLVYATGGTIGMHDVGRGLVPDPAFPAALESMVEQICRSLGAEFRINHQNPPSDSANATAETALSADGLETITIGSGAHEGELDVDALLARHPDVALVDELAHTNVDGSRNRKRWADIEELLDAGIDVISTVNVQHLESVNDVVERITGVRQRETVPDEWVRRAEQVELVDMTPEALRRRLAHGNVYPADRIDDPDHTIGGATAAMSHRE